MSGNSRANSNNAKGEYSLTDTGTIITGGAGGVSGAQLPAGRAIRFSQRNVVTLLCVTAIALIVLITQTWVTVQLDPGSSAVTELSANGAGMHPVLLPAAIAMLVASLVIAIAGRVFKYLLALIVIGLATTIVLVSASLLADPLATVATQLGEVTGITGAGQTELVTDHSLSSLVWVTIFVAVLGQLLGIIVLFSAHRWKSSKKYDVAAEKHEHDDERIAEAAGEAAAESVDESDAADDIDDSEDIAADENAAEDNDARISDWDELSRGNDPSTR